MTDSDDDYDYKDIGSGSESVKSIDDEMIQINPKTHFNKILAEFELDETMVEMYRVIEMHPEVDATPFVEYARDKYKSLNFWLDRNGDLVISVLPRKEIIQSDYDKNMFDSNLKINI